VFEKLVALRSEILYAALGAVGVVALLRVRVGLEMRRARSVAFAQQPDLVQRIINRYGDSGFGLSPKHKFQLALERLAERSRSLTRLLVRLALVAAALLVADRLWLSQQAETASAPAAVAGAPAALASVAPSQPVASEPAPTPAASQASPAALVFTLVSVKVAPGAGDFTDFRLTTFVNGFRYSYPAASPWADLKASSLPFSFPVDLERDYRIAFKGQLKSKSGAERVYAPQPVDVFEWRGRDEERTYTSTAPLVIKYRISTAKTSDAGVAGGGVSKQD
jgi:hypothetical protein